MILPDSYRMAAGGFASAMMVLGGTQIAFAHWGHLGEVAGHGHLMGVALGVAAAAVAAALAVRVRGRANSDEDTPDADSSENCEPEGEPADA